MNPTFFQMDLLNAPTGLMAALLIGMAFGVCLEIGGFGSSKILAGVFYFRDLRVVKVMLSAMFTALLGLLICQKAGVIAPDSIHILPTFYLAAVLGGLLFGIGFAAGGWCPGTAVVGMVSGKLDAWIFLLGSMIGVWFYAALFPWLANLYRIGNAGTVTVFELGNPYWISGAIVLFGMVVLALAESWNPSMRRCEFHRVRRNRGLAVFLLFLLIAWSFYLLLPTVPPENRLAAIAAAQDHMELDALVDALRSETPNLLLVDIRSDAEYQAAHIPGAVHCPLEQLEHAVAAYKNSGTIVLYSNGMTHPAQAREILYGKGFRNVLILTDGFAGFQEQIAKPISLRKHPVSAQEMERFIWWKTLTAEDRNPR